MYVQFSTTLLLGAVFSAPLLRVNPADARSSRFLDGAIAVLNTVGVFQRVGQSIAESIHTRAHSLWAGRGNAPKKVVDRRPPVEHPGSRVYRHDSAQLQTKKWLLLDVE